MTVPEPPRSGNRPTPPPDLHRARPLSPEARQAALRAESARLRQELNQTAVDTWTDWRAAHTAEITAFSWGLRQGRRVVLGWRHLARGAEAHPGWVGSALALGWWIARRKRSGPTRTDGATRPEPFRLLSPSVGLAGALMLLSRLTRLVRWARWLRWGWTLYRHGSNATSAAPHPTPAPRPAQPP